MRHLLLWFLSLPALCSAAVAADAPWVEGVHYFLVDPVQPTQVPAGKVVVVVIFFYACAACNAFYPVMDQLKAALPNHAPLRYLPGLWPPEGDFSTVQGAFFLAQVL